MATAENNTTPQTQEESEYLFLTDSYSDSDGILVAKREWFENMPVCETYGGYGIKVDCDSVEEDGAEECECMEVFAYNYWDGSNFQTVILGSDEMDARYSEITDEEKIKEYEQALDDMEGGTESHGRRYYYTLRHEIVESFWNGDWELYTITERDDTTVSCDDMKFELESLQELQRLNEGEYGHKFEIEADDDGNRIDESDLAGALAFACSVENSPVREIERFNQDDVKGPHSTDDIFTVRVVEWNSRYFVVETSTDDDCVEEFGTQEQAHEALSTNRREREQFNQNGEL